MSPLEVTKLVAGRRKSRTVPWLSESASSFFLAAAATACRPVAQAGGARSRGRSQRWAWNFGGAAVGERSPAWTKRRQLLPLPSLPLAYNKWLDFVID